MKLETVASGTIEGNMPIRSKRNMTISAVGSNFLMKTLSNFYNDPHLAVLREYYANGWDSHVMAGNTNTPVDIILPTDYVPSLIIQDYGTGMSEEFINEIYSVYGESTKRDDNTVIGAFGLGGKSAFALAEQYTVVSCHEGKKITVMFQKGETGSFDVNIVSVLETDSPNGVTITIPIKQNDIYTVRKRAEQFFQYVVPGSARVDGKIPYCILEDPDTVQVSDPDTGITAHYKIHHSYYSRTPMHFVMGGIPYEVSQKEYTESLTRIGHNDDFHINHLTANFVVPMGSFDLSGTREGMQATKRTKDLIDKSLTLLIDALSVAASEGLDDETDYSKVLERAEQWKRIFTAKVLKWHGKPLTTTAITKVVDPDHDIPVRHFFANISKGSYAAQGRLSPQLDLRAASLIILGKDPKEFVDKNLRHVGPFMKANSLRYFQAIVLESLDIFDEDELKKIRGNSAFSFTTFEDFRNTVRVYEADRRAKAKADRIANGGPAVAPKRAKPSYPVLDLQCPDNTVSWIPADEIPDDASYLSSATMITPYDPSSGPRRVVTSYVNPEMRAHDPKSVAVALRALVDTQYVIFLSGARNPKTLKNASGKDFESVITSAKKKAEEAIENADLNAVNKMAASETRSIRVLRSSLSSGLVDQILDPDLREVIKLDNSDAASSTSSSAAVVNALSHLMLMGVDGYTVKHQIEAAAREASKNASGTAPAPTGTMFEKKYPLITVLSSSYERDTVWPEMVYYINTKYKLLEENASLEVLTNS